ncbi:hypothetical protein EMIT0357P_60327 [Pseudomonas marginalis]
MDHPGLGGVVVRLQQAAVDDAAGHGGDIDDGAFATRQHHRGLGLATEENAGEVDVQGGLPALQLQVFGGLGIGNAGAVDGHAEWAEFVLGARDRCIQGGPLGDGAAQGQGAPAQGLDAFYGAGDAGAARKIKAGYIGTGFSEPDGDSLANAAAGAGNKGHLALKTKKLHD